jgi:hypothetical protein
MFWVIEVVQIMNIHYSSKRSVVLSVKDTMSDVKAIMHFEALRSRQKTVGLLVWFSVFFSLWFI